MKITKKLTGITLAQFGFVHVTGLPTYMAVPGEEYYQIQAGHQELGKWGYNNGTMVAITTDGEVWLADGSVQDWGEPVGNLDLLTEPKPFRKTIGELCPEGTGAGVPCSNGEFIPGGLILERLADPTCDCRGFYESVPKVR